MLKNSILKIAICFMVVLMSNYIAPFRGSAENIVSLLPENYSLSDSILNSIFNHASFYSHKVKSFKSNMYLKGMFTIHKKNRIMKYVPSMFSLEDSANNYLHYPQG